MIVHDANSTVSNILTVPHPKLKLMCVSATPKEAKLVVPQLKRELKKYQLAHPDFKVVGLAAPQIGVGKRIFIGLNEVFINPEVLEYSNKFSKSVEGCCSCEGLYEIERPREVKLQWLDNARQLRLAWFRDSMASVVLHEIQHLHGIMICDVGKKVDTMPGKQRSE